MRCPAGSKMNPATGKCKKTPKAKKADAKKASEKRAAAKRAAARKALAKKALAKKAAAKKAAAKKAAPKKTDAKKAAAKKAAAKKAAAKKAVAKKAAAKKAAAKKAAAKKAAAKKAAAKKVAPKKDAPKGSKTTKTARSANARSLARTAGVNFNIQRFNNPKVLCTFSHGEFLAAVKKMGSSQRKIDLKKDLPTSEKPNMLCDNFKEMLDASCVKGWDITGYIGQGAYGTTYGARRKSDGKEGVVKVQTGNSSVLDEIKSQKILHSKKLAPEVFDFCSYKPKSNMVMERGHDKVYIIFMGLVDGVVEDWLNRSNISPESIKMLAQSIFNTLSKLRREGFTHGDFHIGNLGYVYTDSTRKSVTVAPIDFGYTSTEKAFTKFEIMQLVRTLDPSFYKTKNKSPLRALAKEVRRMAMKIYKYKVPSDSVIDKEHEKFHRKYESKYL